MTLLRAQSRSVCLLLCGDGDRTYIQKLRQLAAAEGVEADIHWAGQVSGQLKEDAFRVADVFVLPSYSENFGIAVVEALSAGLPCVVGHGVAVSSEIEKAGAGVAVQTDAAAIAGAISAYLDSADLRTRAGHAARLLAQHSYSVNAMGQGLVDMYQSVCLPRPNSGFKAAPGSGWR